MYSGRLLSQSKKTIKKYSNPFETLKYDKVVAYDYNGSPEMQIVIDGNVLPLKDRIFKKKELANTQIDELNKTLGDTKSYGETTAACFEPHFGIVFFSNNKIVGHISICLACNYFESTPEIPARQSHKTNLCKDCFAYGFTKNARRYISNLIKDLQFSHWQLNSNLFDK